ncbi:MAG TPA: phosphoadenylyl-sulfate reductase [Paenibacillaceae bacterium]|nr:phosphoadenylyl-sulfate reductase [Paenibacillaceae bacterium]
MNNNHFSILYSSWDDRAAEDINHFLDRLDTLEMIRWAYDQYGDGLVYSCSFGAESMVLIDLISRVRPDASILFLDTGMHFPETLQLIKEVQERYPQLRINKIEPAITLTQQEEEYGKELWKKTPDVCCRLRKVEPLQKALYGGKAWISGLRRDQSPSRAQVQFVNKDEKFQSIKICPLIHWKWEDVWNYITAYQLPYNPLHDQGYPSIGCATCTLPVSEEGDSRSGRWSGFTKTECGLHL